MSNKLFKDLKGNITSEDITADLNTIYNKKYVFIFNIISLLSFIVIIYNAISSALLGLPPLGSIAMIDHHVAVLLLLERLSLGIIAFVTTMPFFIMLAIDKIGDYILVSEEEKRQEQIKNNEAITNQMNIANGILMFLAIVLGSYFTSQAIIVHASYLFIACISIAAIYVLQQIIYQLLINHNLAVSTTSVITSWPQVSYNMLLQILSLSQPQKTVVTTKELIASAVAKLAHVNFSEISNEAIYQSLFTNLYEAQLARALENCAKGKAYELISFTTYNREIPSTFHNNLALLDDKVIRSPLFIAYANLLTGEEDNNATILEVIKAKHLFRNHIRSYTDQNKLLTKLKDGSILNDRSLDQTILNYSDNLSGIIIAAWEAEIAEEQSLMYGDITTELQIKLLSDRLKARDELDVTIAKTLNINTNNNNYASIAGFVIGNVNALINGIIIAAITSNILATILPGLWLGFIISNPTTLSIIMAVAFISGWYASYSMTKIAIIDICNNIDYVHYKKQILASNKQNYNNLSYGANATIILAAIGIGILTGIQVFNMLLPLGITLAVISSVFIAIMTVVASGSLFIKFIDKVFAKKKQKEIFLELNFNAEYSEQNKLKKIENWCYGSAIILGLIATALAWYNMHIFAFSVLTGMVTFLAFEIVATIIVNIFCPEVQADIAHIQREICGKVAIFATSLCSMCFFMSTFISITALVVGNIGIILGAITALCIACLYAQYVWSAGASPDVYWQKKLPKVIASNQKEATTPLQDSFGIPEQQDLDHSSKIAPEPDKTTPPKPIKTSAGALFG